MKHSISYRHRFRTQISILFCLAELLPLSAQEQKEDKEIRLNMDAVKMIQFDFNGNSPERKETPKEAPVEKSWMKFKEFTASSLTPSGQSSAKTPSMTNSWQDAPKSWSFHGHSILTQHTMTNMG